MRQNNARRSRGGRGNSNRRSSGNGKSKTFDSNGPDVRIRGNAHQITEKYINLARDAASAGDNTLAESYYQHAEHYQRMINDFAPAADRQPEKNVEGSEGEGKAQKRNPRHKRPAKTVGDKTVAENAVAEQPTADKKLTDKTVAEKSDEAPKAAKKPSPSKPAKVEV